MFTLTKTMDTLQWKEHVLEYIKKEDWVAFCDIWAGERWVDRSAKMKVNRATHPEENAHTVRSVSFATQKARLKTELQQPPNFEEVFDRCHKRKGTGDYVSDRARQIASYQKGREEKYRDQDQRPQLDPEIWVEATGPPRKGNVVCFGHSLGGSTMLASSSTAASHATSQFSTQATHSGPPVISQEQFLQISQQISESVSQQLAQTVSQIQSQMQQMSHQMQQMAQTFSQVVGHLGVHSQRAPPTQQHQDHNDVGGDGQDDAADLG